MAYLENQIFKEHLSYYHNDPSMLHMKDKLIDGTFGGQLKDMKEMLKDLNSHHNKKYVLTSVFNKKN